MAGKNKIIFGVCAWLATKVNLDATLVRIGFVIFTLLGGAGVLAYFVLWIVKILEEK